MANHLCEHLCEFGRLKFTPHRGWDHVSRRSPGCNHAKSAGPKGCLSVFSSLPAQGLKPELRCRCRRHAAAAAAAAAAVLLPPLMLPHGAKISLPRQCEAAAATVLQPLLPSGHTDLTKGTTPKRNFIHYIVLDFGHPAESWAK